MAFDKTKQFLVSCQSLMPARLRTLYLIKCPHVDIYVRDQVKEMNETDHLKLLEIAEDYVVHVTDCATDNKPEEKQVPD